MATGTWSLLLYHSHSWKENKAMNVTGLCLPGFSHFCAVRGLSRELVPPTVWGPPTSISANKIIPRGMPEAHLPCDPRFCHLDCWHHLPPRSLCFCCFRSPGLPGCNRHSQFYLGVHPFLFHRWSTFCLFSMGIVMNLPFFFFAFILTHDHPTWIRGKDLQRVKHLQLNHLER